MGPVSQTRNPLTGVFIPCRNNNAGWRKNEDLKYQA
jgi:hypothetical protein